jgi:hypothetical protein
MKMIFGNTIFKNANNPKNISIIEKSNITKNSLNNNSCLSNNVSHKSNISKVKSSKSNCLKNCTKIESTKSINKSIFYDNNIKKKENQINDKDLNNSINLKLSEKINDELYPGEEFNIKVYNDSKIPSTKKEEKPFCPENIYINNLNIFENNFLGQICKNQNNNVIETEKKSKSEEKKIILQV